MTADAKTLTPKQLRFCEEYLVDLNATQAAERAGYSKRRAKQTGFDLLQLPLVQAAIKQLMVERSARTGITADRVVERFWQMATADPNELVEYRRTCCRHCYGAGFRYQRTAGEMETAREAWEATQAKASKSDDPAPAAAFDERGGIGYDPRKAPHPECPECFGEGVGEVFAKDTRHLSDAARALYAGVKVTKDGWEVKLNDQPSALVNVGRHLGVFDEKKAGDVTRLEIVLRDEGPAHRRSEDQAA